MKGQAVQLPRHGYVESYQAAWSAAGHRGVGSVYLRIPLYAAATDAAAADESRESITYYFRRQSELARTGTGSGTATSGERLAQADELAALSRERILRERVVVGCADTLVTRLRHLRAELHLDGIIVELNPGGMIPMDNMMRSLRILAENIAPALR